MCEARHIRRFLTNIKMQRGNRLCLDAARAKLEKSQPLYPSLMLCLSTAHKVHYIVSLTACCVFQLGKHIVSLLKFRDFTKNIF